MIVKYIVFFAFLGAITAEKSKSTTENLNSTTRILDLWNKLDKDFIVNTNQNVVLFIGPSRSGKSTLTLLLTGAHLVINETSKGSGQFVFSDLQNKIGNSTSTSFTIIPEPVDDPEINAAYYDCPGFEDSREGYEVPVAYLIHKLLTNAKAFKIVLVVNRSVLIKGETRNSFPDLVKYVVMLLKDIDRYKNTIGLVATKVDNTFYEDENGEIIMHDDATLIRDIENYFKEEKDGAEKKNKEPGQSPEDRRFNNEKIKLLDVLMTQNPKAPNGFERINIFRRAMEKGELKDLSEIQKNKDDIKTMIRDHLKYVDKDNSVGIGYVISSKAENEMNKLIDHILNNKLVENVMDVCSQMENHYKKSFEKETKYGDLNKLKTNIDKDLDSISTSEPLMFANNLISVANNTSSNIKTSQVEKNIEFVNFLIKVKPKQLTMSTTLKNKTDDVKQFVLSQYNSRVEFLITQLLNIRLPNAITPVSDEIEKFFSNTEQNTHDLQELRDKISGGYTSLAEVSLSDPQTLLNAIKNMSIVLSKDASAKMNDVIGDFVWYRSTKKEHSDLLDKSVKILEKTKDKLKKALSWYDSLIEVYSDLCSFHCEKPEEERAIIEGLLDRTSSARKVRDIDFGKLKTCTKKEYSVLSGLGDETLDSHKRNALKTILSHSLVIPTISCSADKLHMTVKGNIVRMSSVVQNQDCWQTARFVKVFARDTVVVDSDVNKVGSNKDLAIMARVWSVVGKKTISFVGDNGKSKGKAKDGEVKNRSPGHGESGEVGYPGEPGGNCFGIGHEFVNGAGLTIKSKGGDGGPGQNAGKGANGVDATKPFIQSSSDSQLDKCLDVSYASLPLVILNFYTYKEVKRELEWKCMETYLQAEKFSEVDRSFWNREDKKLKKTGEAGVDGGNGGNGGEGGAGGKPGLIEIFELGSRSKIQVESIPGNKGLMGTKGLGGSEAQRSYIMEINIKDSWWVGIPGVKLKWDTKVYEDTYNPKTRKGIDGVDGISNVNPSDSRPAAYSYDRTAATNDFKAFIKEGSQNSFRDSKVKAFISLLENNEGYRGIVGKH